MIYTVFKIRSETCRTENTIFPKFIYDKEGKCAGPTQILPVRVCGPALILKTIYICWWLADTRCKDISRSGIDVPVVEYSMMSAEKINEYESPLQPFYSECSRARCLMSIASHSCRVTATPYAIRAHSNKYTLGNPFAYPGINIMCPFCYLRWKCSFRLI